MKSNKIKVVFFDFDGTISDSKSIAFDSLAETLEEFGISYNKKTLMHLLGMKTNNLLRELGLEEKLIPKVQRAFYRKITRNVLNSNIQTCVSLKPLWRMREEGWLMFVVSNGKSTFLRASIKKLAIKGLFRKIYGAEIFKSKDEKLLSLFKQLKILPSEAVYVGDRFSDIEFAKKSGCISVAIHNKCSWSTIREVKAQKPDYIIKDFYELRKLLSKLNQN